MKWIIFAPRNHLLTNTGTWTPDDQWLVFDVRPSGASFTGETIERVSTHTDEVEVIYRVSRDIYVGVVTVRPKSEKYISIHGPENPDETWYCDFHHRRRVIVENGKMSNFDIMDTTTPYMPGALRGGSHVYVFSPDGEGVSFTCNDHVIHELNPTLDLRNVGVAAPFGLVDAQKQHLRGYSGNHWYVLVGRTTPTPQPGSDEINRAYEEGWVGNHALMFIGNTFSAKGKKMPELFIVKLPRDGADWKATGDTLSSETGTTLFAPPRGVMQRHLTFAHHRVCPGLVNVPRYWVRHNPQGTQIAFLICDDNGTVQLWLISPQGDEPHQLTRDKTNIQPAFNWHPSRKWLGLVPDNWTTYTHAQSDEVEYSTGNHANPSSTDVAIFSPNGQWLAWMGDGQLWTTEANR